LLSIFRLNIRKLTYFPYNKQHRLREQRSKGNNLFAIQLLLLLTKLNLFSPPDGREGFQNIFLRRGFNTCLVDQSRRGKAGRSTVASTVKPAADEQKYIAHSRE
jgi:hypothetical protein